MTRKFILSMTTLSALAVLAALSACTSDQLARVSAGAERAGPEITAACNTASTLANIAGLVPGVGAIVPYINVACFTAEGLDKLAADPSSLEWIGTLSGKIKVLASRAGLKL